jgi:hypothetical protein
MIMHLMKKLLLAIVLVFIAAISACTPVQQESASSDSEELSPLTGNQDILNELTAVSQLVNKKIATPDDFEKLEGMVAVDEDAEHEVEEIATLVKYKEYTHAGHGIGFLDGYIRTGKELLCPSHALVHYYVFEKHGEDELANHAMEEIEESFDEWVPLAREYDEKYPGGQDFDDIVKVIKGHIESIEKGDKTATDAELDFLLKEAGICVEEE